MMSPDMMYDSYYSKLSKEEQEEEADNCICGYKLRRESEYTNTQGQVVSVMVCDSCGKVEHWVENDTHLSLETK